MVICLLPIHFAEQVDLILAKIAIAKSVECLVQIVQPAGKNLLVGAVVLEVVAQSMFATLQQVAVQQEVAGSFEAN